MRQLRAPVLHLLWACKYNTSANVKEARTGGIVNLISSAYCKTHCTIDSTRTLCSHRSSEDPPKTATSRAPMLCRAAGSSPQTGCLCPPTVAVNQQRALGCLFTALFNRLLLACGAGTTWAVELLALCASGASSAAGPCPRAACAAAVLMLLQSVSFGALPFHFQALVGRQLLSFATPVCRSTAQQPQHRALRVACSESLSSYVKFRAQQPSAPTFTATTY